MKTALNHYPVDKYNEPNCVIHRLEIHPEASVVTFWTITEEKFDYGCCLHWIRGWEIRCINLPLSPGGPGSPGPPGEPSSPLSPLSPWGPVSPASPSTPWSPFSPFTPVADCPGSPLGPATNTSWWAPHRDVRALHWKPEGKTTVHVWRKSRGNLFWFELARGSS